MAGEYLRSHGIDIDKEMSRIQNEASGTNLASEEAFSASITLSHVSLPGTPAGSSWDVSISNGRVSAITAHNSHAELPAGRVDIDGHGALLARSLCHPHVHIDKAYLLSHPRYSHLKMEKGDFAEAMSLTGKAKREFENRDLLERGQRLIDESAVAGVTHMRGFIEVDAVVGTKCLDAGLELKQKAAENRNCIIQLCAFAQMPLFTASDGDEDGASIRGLMQEAASMPQLDVIGSTPYVEADSDKMHRNVEWMVDLSIEQNVHLDFHLDYNLKQSMELMIWHVIKTLKEKKWKQRTVNKTVVLGHCTRLTLLNEAEWQELKEAIGDLPISFVGLPTSDLFMMKRGTLNVPTMIKEYGLNACIGINNIGNAFTPHGSCDPLTLACNGVGVYQAGTEEDAEILYQCVSTRAKKAIGLQSVRRAGEQAEQGDESLGLKVGDEANLLLFGSENESWRTRTSVAEVVYLYDHCRNRKAYLQGELTTEWMMQR